MDKPGIQLGQMCGKGTFGDVFLGYYDHSPKVPIAVKRIRMPFGKEYEEHRDECFREASLLRTLSHENVLHCTDVFEKREINEIWIITEYIDGGSMKRFCNNNTNLNFVDKKRIAKLCWLGLAYLHDRHVCHKDIKPENILISDDLQLVKIADFGLAVLKDAASLFSTHEIKGAVMYLPPELASTGGMKRHKQKSDVYSMGASLCEFFSGQPFWANREANQVLFTLLKQQHAVENNEVPSEPSCFSSLSVSLRLILLNAVEPDHTKRWYAHEMVFLFQDNIINKLCTILLGEFFHDFSS